LQLVSSGGESRLDNKSTKKGCARIEKNIDFSDDSDGN